MPPSVRQRYKSAGVTTPVTKTEQKQKQKQNDNQDNMTYTPPTLPTFPITPPPPPPTDDPIGGDDGGDGCTVQ